MPTAQEIALLYMTPRYMRLERFERYTAGTQYEGRPPFMATDEHAAPLLERAPCIVYGIAKTAIRDLIAFTMGESRYPFFSACSSEDDENVDEEWGLDRANSSTLERWINGPLSKTARLKTVFPHALDMAMTAGSVAVVGSIKRGLPRLECLPAKWCTPEFDANGDVCKLVVQYPYIVTRWHDVEKKWVDTCFLYRREIDATSDTVMLPGVTDEEGRLPSWQPDPMQTTAHALGFCPVRWYTFDRTEPTAASFDGKPIHETLLDEIDALNFSLSQRHRGAIYSGDPQLWETGVDAMTNPAPMGRAARGQIDVQASGPGGVPVGVFTSQPKGSRASLRKKGPGVVWRYPDAQSKVGMLTLPDGALGAIDDHAADLRKKLSEDLSVVLLDPSEAKSYGVMSGKALAFMFARQVARADSIRSSAGDDLLLASVDMLLRISLAVHNRSPGGVRIPGIEKVAPILERFMADVATSAEGEAASQEWFGPRLDLQWGRYFTASSEEEAAVVTLVCAAYAANLITQELALEKLRDVFDFSSTAEIVERLEEERAKKQEQLAADMHAMGGPPGNDEGGAPKAMNKPSGKTAKAAAKKKPAVGE